MTTDQLNAKLCSSCLEEIPTDARFCNHCGTGQDGAAEQVTDPAPTASPQTYGHHCPVCGGEGVNLPADREYCPCCRWLRPLTADYHLDPTVFLWQLDGEAMTRLHGIGPINALAHKISETVGRPWFEAAVNGVRLGEDQLPDVFAYAICAARIMGLRYLPEIYVSGENMWDAVTMGSATGCFVSLGSVLTNMRGTDLLYVLAREMGHVAAGHALWRTVVELAAGKQGPSSLVGSGFLEYLNPMKIVQGAIQAPLLAWKRHSQITADRAGLIVAGDMEVATRVLTQWSLKSFPLYARINQDAWRLQEEESDDATIRMSEFLMTSNPYLARRLKLLREFELTEEYQSWRHYIDHFTKDLPGFDAQNDGGNKRPNEGEMVKLTCAKCRTPMRVPRAALEGGDPVNVRCPNSSCRSVMSVKPRKRSNPGPETMTE